jgi:OFA family oxalate/formate antiporter-like MFS transporter
MLVAWGFTSAFGPLLIAHMRDAASSNRGALPVIAGIMAISTLLPILVRPPRNGDTDRTEIESHLSRKRWA